MMVWENLCFYWWIPYEDTVVSNAEEVRQILQSAVGLKEHDLLTYLNSIGNAEDDSGTL